MTLIGRKILLTNTDDSGNPTLDFPITSIECVEGAVTSVNGQKGAVTVGTITDISISGITITVSFADGTTKSLTTQDTMPDTSVLGVAYKIPYGTCPTATNTAAKVATITNGVLFSLEVGTVIAIKFSNLANFNKNSTLNVNSTGAKPIKYVEETSGGSSMNIKHQNITYVFLYDGTYWNTINNDINVL